MKKLINIIVVFSSFLLFLVTTFSTNNVSYYSLLAWLSLSQTQFSTIVFLDLNSRTAQKISLFGKSESKKLNSHM